MKILKKLSLAIVITILGGCSIPVKPPLYINDNFSPNKDQKVVVISPILNLGRDNELDTDLDKTGLVIKHLKRRGYNASVKIIDNVESSEITKSLETKDFTWLKKSSLDESDWVMVVAVDYLKRSSHQGIGIRGDAYISAYIIDMGSYQLLWEGMGYGGTTGGIVMAAFVDDDSMLYAYADLFKGLPLVHNYEKLPTTKNLFDGVCRNECSNNNSKAEICLFDSKKVTPEENSTSDIQVDMKHILYDGTSNITTIKGGQYTCWKREAGRIYIHINEGRPAYFRAEAGKSYYVEASHEGKWAFNELLNGSETELMSRYENIGNTH